VRYAKGFGRESPDRASIEWRFAPHWSFESELSHSGASGVDLIWTHEF
jgi:hypothetical protein